MNKGKEPFGDGLFFSAAIDFIDFEWADSSRQQILSAKLVELQTKEVSEILLHLHLWDSDCVIVGLSQMYFCVHFLIYI